MAKRGVQRSCYPDRYSWLMSAEANTLTVQVVPLSAEGCTLIVEAVTLNAENVP